MEIKQFLEIKERVGMTAVKLAKHLGVTDIQVHNYISGRRDILRRTKNQMLILDLLYKIRAKASISMEDMTVFDLCETATNIKKMIDDVLEQTSA